MKEVFLSGVLSGFFVATTVIIELIFNIELQFLVNPTEIWFQLWTLSWAVGWICLGCRTTE